MGSLGSTNWAQATMEDVFQDVIQDVELYIDDIGIFDTDWDNHIKTINLVLTRLEENSLPLTLSSVNAGPFMRQIGLAVISRLMDSNLGTKESNRFLCWLLQAVSKNSNPSLAL
jgi:hypothetical protein